jgi:alkylation response protein AidB-like acyl-CoA dehydrogenase
MDFGFTEEQRLLRDSVRKLLHKHAPPDYVRQHDRERTYPEELFQAFAEAGLLALPFPEAYGGAGGTVLDMVIVAEEIARVSADLVMAYTGGIFCGLNLVRMASEEQKRHWLPQFLEGKIKFSISMSEAGRLRYRRHAHHRGERRQRMGDRRPQALGLDRGRQEQCHQSLCEDRSQGALSPGDVAVPGR